MEKYAEEARQRWGDTEAFRQSLFRVEKMGKAGLNQVLKEGEKLLKEDERFKAFYERIADGLAQFMHDGMIYYADMGEAKGKSQNKNPIS